MELSISRFERRLLSWGMVLAGVVHLLVPGVLLWTARLGYRWLLAVEFDPNEGARCRVRAIGVGFLAVAAALGRRSDG